MDYTTLVLLCLLWFICFLAMKYRKPEIPLPPGPKPWPLIGNVLHMPTIRPWERYRKWCETYNSDIVYLRLPLKPAVVVGSAQAAMDLFEKRSHIYSDRNTSVMTQLSGWDFNMGLMPYSSRWRIHRRMFHQHFHAGIVNKYRPVQLKKVRESLSWFLTSPEHTRKHVRVLTTSVIFRVTYAKDIRGMDDEYVTVAETAIEGLSKMYIPGWVPGAKSVNFAKKYVPMVNAMRDKPFAEVEAAMAEGTNLPSVTSSVIRINRLKYENPEDYAFFSEVATNVTGVAYAAGSDTTTSACLSFLLTMATYPSVQKEAQAQLDDVVGSDRLPEYDDLQNLPYIRALVMETMRWLPVLPFGIPHAAIEDDVYNGVRIPKGCALIPNTWAMLHDPKDYPDPDTFNPGRFIGKDGQIDPTIRDPTTMAFGFGRRICPGRHFSNNTLSMFIASILHVFDVSAGVDASGNPIPLTSEMDGGLVAMPHNVPCGLKPRSEEAVQLIRHYS